MQEVQENALWNAPGMLYTSIPNSGINLLKGASGQAVENMNLMFGWDEKLGLNLKTVAF